jgi:L-arabinose isomerase
MAFVDTFQDLGGLKQLPGIGAQRLMADGYGFGAEGDWKSSMLVRIVKAASEGLEGGVSFMEDYTYDFGADATAVLGAHMLEVCPTIAAATPSCEIHPLFVGEREDPVRLVFTAAPGPGVVVGMVDMGTHLRLVANEVDAIEPPGDLPALPVARALWVPRPDFTTAAESWLMAGGPHHTAYSQAIGLDVIEDLAEMLDVELLAIDADTTVRGFKKELGWTAAYRLLRTGP